MSWRLRFLRTSRALKYPETGASLCALESEADAPSRTAGASDRRPESGGGATIFSEHMAEGISVVAPKVSDRLEVRLQMSQQPDHLDIAMGLSLQPTARPQPVQIAVNVKLQQIGGRVAGRPVTLGSTWIQPIDKSIDEAHRVVRADIIVNRLRQE
jgi:hypothetical protein